MIEMDDLNRMDVPRNFSWPTPTRKSASDKVSIDSLPKTLHIKQHFQENINYMNRKRYSIGPGRHFSLSFNVYFSCRHPLLFSDISDHGTELFKVELVFVSLVVEFEDVPTPHFTRIVAVRHKRLDDGETANNLIVG